MCTLNRFPSTILSRVFEQVQRKKMMFVCVFNNGQNIKTYGNNDLQYLIDVVKNGMSVGYNYKFYSKGHILKIEILSPDEFVAIFTNLEKQRHSWVIKQVLDQMEADLENLHSDDDATFD